MLIRVEQCLRKHRIPPSRFGRDALGDPCLVFELRDGRELRPATAARLRAYLDALDARVIDDPR